jgi:hypothetical protein
VARIAATIAVRVAGATGACLCASAANSGQHPSPRLRAHTQHRTCQAFEEIFAKYDRDNKGGLTYREVREMCAEQVCAVCAAVGRPGSCTNLAALCSTCSQRALAHALPCAAACVCVFVEVLSGPTHPAFGPRSSPTRNPAPVRHCSSTPLAASPASWVSKRDRQRPGVL